MTATLPPFDAVLLLSFGGPDKPDDVMPFLENVTRGRAIPRDRLEAVAANYMLLGGKSPINDECRRLLAGLQSELARRGPALPLYWGNRNWPPMLQDTVAQMARDGIKRAVAIATSAYSSYSACRQYLEDIERARAAVGPTAPLIEKIAPYWNHPGFLETMIAHTRDALSKSGSKSGTGTDLPGAEAAADESGDVRGARAGTETGPGVEHAGASTRLVFTAHSIPTAMAATCDYVDEVREASSIVAAAAAPRLPWDVAYQSRSGPPRQPWLEPDICEHLRTLQAEGVRRVVLVPIGFVADHMEVVYDLDTQARAVAVSLGLTMTRAACVGSAPQFLAGLGDLVRCHVEGHPPQTLGARGPRPSPCRPGCCAYNPRH